MRYLTILALLVSTAVGLTAQSNTAALDEARRETALALLSLQKTPAYELWMTLRAKQARLEGEARNEQEAVRKQP